MAIGRSVSNEVDKNITPAWPEENIPDQDLMYYRVHKNYIDLETGGPKPGAFGNQPKSDPNSAMSTDWEKYATPHDTQNRGAQLPVDVNYAIISLNAGDVRNLGADELQYVNHTPDKDRNNRAHTDVRGKKTPEVRRKLMLCYVMAIALKAAD